MDKFQITKPPKVWVSGFLSVNGNGILAPTIIENFPLYCKYQSYGNFQITDPLQSLGLHFSECQQKQNISICHYENIKKWLPYHKY